MFQDRKRKILFKVKPNQYIQNLLKGKKGWSKVKLGGKHRTKKMEGNKKGNFKKKIEVTTINYQNR